MNVTFGCIRTMKAIGNERLWADSSLFDRARQQFAGVEFIIALRHLDPNLIASGTLCQ
jgi:hypothetical protein